MSLADLSDFGLRGLNALRPENNDQTAKEFKGALAGWDPGKQSADQAFRPEFERRFPFVDFDYIVTMNEIGRLGDIKHGDNCIERRIRKGDYSRYGERVYRTGFRKHSDEHWREYIEGVKHDAFGTSRHQLGAVGYNGMLEFKLSRLAGEGADKVEKALDQYRKTGERA